MPIIFSLMVFMSGIAFLLAYIHDRWGRDALAVAGLALICMTGMVAFLAVSERLAVGAINWCMIGILICVSLIFLVDYGRRKGYRLIHQKLSPRTVVFLTVAVFVGMALSTRSPLGRSLQFVVAGQVMSMDFISHILAGAVIFVILFDILDEITAHAKVFAFWIMIICLGIMEVYDWSVAPIHGSHLDCVADFASNAVGGGIMWAKVQSFLYRSSGKKR